MSTRAFGSASASKRLARRSFSDTIAAPSPSPWKAGATMPSAKTSVKGGSASTLRKPHSSPLGDSTTAKSRSRSTPGAVQRPRSQSASSTGTPRNATHSSFEKAATSSASSSCGGRIRKPGGSSIAPVCRTKGQNKNGSVPCSGRAGCQNLGSARKSARSRQRSKPERAARVLKRAPRVQERAGSASYGGEERKPRKGGTNAERANSRARRSARRCACLQRSGGRRQPCRRLGERRKRPRHPQHVRAGADRGPAVLVHRRAVRRWNRQGRVPLSDGRRRRALPGAVAIDDGARGGPPRQ